MQESTYRLSNLDCADCAAHLEEAIGCVRGVREVSVNFAAARMTVRHETDDHEIIAAVRRLGYEAHPEGAEMRTGSVLREPRTIATALSGLLILGGLLLSRLASVDVTLAYAGAIAVGGFYPARAAYHSLKNRLNVDMNVLMMTAVAGAAAIGEWVEGATVIFLYSLGHVLESYTIEGTRRSIKKLMDLSPPTARLLRGGEEVEVSVEAVAVGDVVAVRPGERIPVDGVVRRGRSSVDQSPITGESMPVLKEAGSEVFAGTVNGEGYLEVETTRTRADTTLARIIKMVEEASATKAPSQRFVDVFARYYTPAVIGLAVLLATVPPLFGGEFKVWFYRALTLLVIACPCALVISTPVSIVSAIGNAARHGVLIKGGVHLEEAGRIRTVAFDKTGTLTEGEPSVVDIISLDDVDVLEIAASVELHSEHPIAAAITREAAAGGLRPRRPEGFKALAGLGARATLDGETYLVGSPRLFALDPDLQARVRDIEEQGRTVVVVGTEERVLGLLSVADATRPTSRGAVKELHDMGVDTVLLTGDNPRTARAVADALGVGEFKAGLLPGDKVREVRDLMAGAGHVAMVGDGINDAPALATASLGVAMGGVGSDVALETADIVVLSDDPARVPYTLKLGRRAQAIIKQNVTFALLVKLAAVVLVFLGQLNLWLAILADTGASLAVILNGMRLLAGRPTRPSSSPAL